jgi:hypothetical protein
VAEVILGCAVGLLITWLMSVLWPLPEPASAGAANKP